MALAEDIQRFLNDEPVVAGPPSTGYRLAKFIRRNRVSVAAAAVATLSVVAGLVLATVGFLHARHERDLARRAKDELVVTNRALDTQLRQTEAVRVAETEANDRAKADAATTDAVNRFLNKILRAASPHGLGRDTTVRAALDYASKNIDTEFPQRPFVKMAILNSLASTYLDLGEYAKAEAHSRRAVELYAATVGPEHDATLRSMDELAQILSARGKVEEATEVMRRVCGVLQRKTGMEHRDTLIAHNNLAALLARQNKLDEAIEIMTEVLKSKRALLGESDDSTLSTWSNLSALRVRRGEKEEAIASLTKIVDIVTAKHGESDPRTIDALEQLVLAQSFVDVREVIPTYRKLVDLRGSVYGQDHPETVRTMLSLSASLLGAGQPSDAEPILRNIVAWNDKFAESRGIHIDADLLLVESLAAQGKGAEAESIAREYLGALKASSAGSNFPSSRQNRMLV